MPVPPIPGMQLSDFFKRRLEYEKKAIARRVERMNLNDLDSNHARHVIEEMLIDLLVRIERLEGILALGSTDESANPVKAVPLPGRMT